MAGMNRPKARNVTPQAESILEAIRDCAGWITRREIAESLDKARLNPWDQALLRKLEAEGLIEASRRLRSDDITFEYIYRAVEVSETV